MVEQVSHLLETSNFQRHHLRKILDMMNLTFDIDVMLRFKSSIHIKTKAKYQELNMSKQTRHTQNNLIL